MLYFDLNDHMMMNEERGVNHASEKMHQLHRALYQQLRSYSVNLHPQAPCVVSFQSVSDPFARDVVALRYMRGPSEAQAVERMMADGWHSEMPHDCHPAIEVRLTPDHVAVEMVIAPSAWWDQQNLVGKLSVERQRNDFYRLLRQMDCEVQIGFWQGAFLSDVRLSTCDIYNPRILNEWMNTFAEGQDWVRAGVWYEPGHPALDEETIVAEVFQRICDLHKLYTFMTWTSDNDFRSVYQKLLARTA